MNQQASVQVTCMLTACSNNTPHAMSMPHEAN